MVNSIGKAAQELHGIDPLPVQMARIEIEAELLSAAQGFQGHLRTIEIEGDLAGVDLEGKAHATLLANVQDGIPALSKTAECRLNLRCGRGRIPCDRGPDGGT